MKKWVILVAVCLTANFVFAAGTTQAKTAKKKANLEFVVIESEDYASGKQDPQATAGLASFFKGEAKVTTLTAKQAKEDPKLANIDVNFLPLYLVKKTKALRDQVAPHIQAGYVQETDEYLIFPQMTRTGVYESKEARPGVLEIFVMSQCPYGVMAEGLVINAKKEGKIPADKTIRLRYIVNYDKQKDEFQSLHGSAEWEEDVRQLLIAKYYPEKLWKYLEIRNKDYRSSRWDKAMEEAGINVKKIMKKFDKEGKELLKQEAVYGDEYNINASPSFLWEGKESLDFGSVSQKEGLEFLNPARGQRAAAAPVGSC